MFVVLDTETTGTGPEDRLGQIAFTPEGGGRLHRVIDWTASCIAVTNWEIEELWRAVPDDTPVRIKP
jgi:hypothetical protein